MSTSDGHEVGRRSAIKKGVAGAAAAGLVWSGPQIEKLTLRPRYAAAQTPVPPIVFVVNMTGANEVPPNMSAFTGTATLTFPRDAGTGQINGTVQVAYALSAGFMPTAAHIHGPAAAGANAGVAMGLGVVDTTFVVPVFRALLIVSNPGQYYVNMHSAEFPNGEIRGQLG